MRDRRELSRAELVRRRRAQRTAKEFEQSSRRALKPIVPVTARIPAHAVTSKPRLVAKPRRFNVALGLSELLLQKPHFSIPRFHANWRMISILSVLLLGGTIYLTLTLPYFFVPGATTLGNNRLSSAEINTVLGVTGQSIFAVQSQEIETRLLMNYPELLSAEVNVYLPNQVYVTVAERQPVILWQIGAGYTWIDAAGVAFRPRGFVEGLVPVSALDEPPAGAEADTLGPPPYMQRELVDAILALSPLVPAGSTLTFDSAEGLGWTDSRGWKVSFGASPKDIPLKMRVYQSLVDSLIARGRFPEIINVVYADAPFYRMPENAIEDSTEEIVSSGQ